MYIQSNYDNVNMCGSNKNSKFWQRLKQKTLDKLPECTFNDNGKIDKWNKIDGFLSHPAENRLIMGATALLTQPAIDYYNHKVDEETREVAKNRTLAKILAGTAVGMLVRGSSYEIIKKMTDVRGKGKGNPKSKFCRAFLPKEHYRSLAKNPRLLKNYRNALSTSMAILAMCITNFAIDAPLTVFLTNYFNEKHAQKAMKNTERRTLNE